MLAEHTPLVLLTAQNYPGAIQALQASGKPAGEALRICARAGLVAQAVALVQQGWCTDIDYAPPDLFGEGKSALILAAEAGAAPLVEFFIRSGARKSVFRGLSVAHYAHNVQVIHVLQAYQCLPAAGQITPLHTACQQVGDCPKSASRIAHLVQALSFHYSAAHYSNGYTALHVLLMNNPSNITALACLLVDAGIVSLEASDGRTPMGILLSQLLFSWDRQEEEQWRTSTLQACNMLIALGAPLSASEKQKQELVTLREALAQCQGCIDDMRVVVDIQLQRRRDVPESLLHQFQAMRVVEQEDQAMEVAVGSAPFKRIV